MKKNIFIIIALVCAIVMCTSFYTPAKSVESKVTLTSDYESICMALDLLDVEVYRAMEDEVEFDYTNTIATINTLKETTVNNYNMGNLNFEETFNEIDALRNTLN